MGKRKMDTVAKDGNTMKCQVAFSYRMGQTEKRDLRDILLRDDLVLKAVMCIFMRRNSSQETRHKINGKINFRNCITKRNRTKNTNKKLRNLKIESTIELQPVTTKWNTASITVGLLFTRLTLRR